MLEFLKEMSLWSFSRLIFLPWIVVALAAFGFHGGEFLGEEAVDVGVVRVLVGVFFLASVISPRFCFLARLFLVGGRGYKRMVILGVYFFILAVFTLVGLILVDVYIYVRLYY